MLVRLPFGSGGRLTACPPPGLSESAVPPLVSQPTLGGRITYWYAFVSVLRLGAYFFLNSLALPAIVYWQGEGINKAVEGMTGRLDMECRCACGRVSYRRAEGCRLS